MKDRGNQRLTLKLTKFDQRLCVKIWTLKDRFDHTNVLYEESSIQNCCGTLNILNNVGLSMSPSNFIFNLINTSKTTTLDLQNKKKNGIPLKNPKARCSITSRIVKL
ncbi:hypothetical protein ACKWTF_011449 [Chironomus riparius]